MRTLSLIDIFLQRLITCAIVILLLFACSQINKLTKRIDKIENQIENSK